MSTHKRKAGIVTFKVDPDLMESLEAIPNRSEFIRTAILAAMDNLCPVCNGTGVLSPGQRKHWEKFSASHAISRCAECQENFLVCEHEHDGVHEQDATTQ